MSREIRHLYKFDAFRLDPAERLLLRDGAPVPLTPKVFKTLLVLLAVLYAALGEREQAFASLEKVCTAHDLQLQ